MNKAIPIAGLIILLIVAFIVNNAIFIVIQNEQCVITQFGGFVRTVKEPGLHFNLPFIQNVIYYDNRLLNHDVQPTEIVTKDKRTLVIDNFAKWRITDPEQFYKRAKSEKIAKERLRDIIYSELRLDFGSRDLADIVTKSRAELMTEVTQRSNQKVKELAMGVEIADVRIKRADLPPENQQAVFQRMSEERKRIAKQWRAEGNEEARKIRAGTDKEKVIILSEAYKTSQEIRGAADAQSIRITAAAFGQDPEFYEFMRSMEAYKKSIEDRGSIVLSTDNPFLKYLRQ